ncbi:SDR family oxidoreductase [Candidatus Leptofilum sp.]|uniref:SDR family oxidoreductase n=1 Tax=Candidatus Leptofilum sp. TaxID=3241576 RepID=UPI003B599BF4
MQLDGKIALITGGGSGIGRETAVLFANHGAKIAIADLNPKGGQETVQIITQTGGQAIFVQTDVSQAAQVENMVNAVVGAYGRLDIAFNNAGIEGHTDRTVDVTETEFDQIMAVNVKGVWLCLKYQIPQMIAQGGGAIVNTASVAGLVGTHSMPVYGASKHAVIGLTKSAALEYARKGIRINAVCPSVIRTPMVERGFVEFPQFVEATKRINPMRRLGEPIEVAEAVLWLCSDAASFVNGTALTIDGGFTAQ